MLIIPAIDLKDGACVRLRQGRMDDSTVFGDDPVAMAARWVEEGARRLHLVDLNGAFAGEPVNGAAVRAITRAFPALPVQIGGGIRSRETVRSYLDAGALCAEFPGHVIVGIDARNGMVATDGWAEVSRVSAVDLAQQFAAAGVAAIVYTDIDRDGMMQGVNIPATRHLAEAGGIPVIASGGVTTIEDIELLAREAANGIVGAISGRALYEGTLDLRTAQAWCDANAAGG